jgi:mRNA-degrading endonuclease toxin of MazEF toxin-antitoxin module
VLSVDALNRHALDVCVVPITTKQHGQFSMRVPLKAKDGGLHFNCWAKCDQVTTVEKSLFRDAPVGTLSPISLQRIETQVRIALGLT